jgi:replication factor C subunit 3/5
MTLAINASEDRGIDTIRKTILEFLNTKNLYDPDNKSLYKLVILDEADAMTPDAQAMLRQVIEKYSSSARFCLVCNYIKKITHALQSRCACYRFAPLKPQEIKKRIKYVAKCENINITEDGINTLIKRSKGDMRKILNILQTTSMSYKQINEFSINKCLGYPNSTTITIIFVSLFNDNYQKSYDIVRDLKTQHTYTLQDIITEIADIIIEICKTANSHKLDSFRMITILEKLSKIEYNLTTCVSETLQMAAFIGIFKS